MEQWPSSFIYYMASSVSGQDEPNRALWSATRAGKSLLFIIIIFALFTNNYYYIKVHYKERT